MNENKNFGEKRNDIDFRKVWKFLKKTFLKLWEKIKKFWNYLKKQKVVKFFGAVIAIFSGLMIFFETLLLALIHSDREKFSEILNYFYQINIFDYLSVKDFYWITGGGYLIDMTFYLIFLFLGLIWWKKKNYFKNSLARIILGILFGLGVLIFSIGFYRAMPEIMVPLEKICQDSEKYHHSENEYLRNGWKIKREELPNGFREEGIYRVPGEERYFYQFFNTI